MQRRLFLRSLAGLIGGSLLAAKLPAQISAPLPAGTPKPPPKPPAFATEKVQAMIVAAHRSLDTVKKLVEETPLLVNASWDWGGGDFETPLQATAHIGQPAIAEFLLAHYARIDLYASAMLGQLDLIKAAFVVDPKAHEIPGPHGFTLLHCARAGGARAKPVYDWLIAQGVPEIFQRPLPFIWPAGTGPAGT